MNNKFSFNTEADCFERAFTIGSGKLGAMIYGGVCSDRLSLNSDTLWSGHPESGGAPKNAPQIYRQAAQLANEGKNYEADKLLEESFNYTIGQYYLPGGSVYINSSYTDLSDYKRTLNMSDGTVHVGFKVNGVSYNRIYFASEKYDCIAVKEKSEKNGGLSFKVSYESEVRLTETEIRRDVLLISGICPYDADRTEYYNPQFVYSELCAKGNITVSASWNDGKVTELTLETPVPQTVIIKVNGTETELRLEANIKSVVPLSNRGF